MKKVLLLLTVSAVLVLPFASAALAEQHGGAMTASPTATATASPTATATATASPTATATALPRSGGPPLVLPVTLAASLALIATGVGALVLMQRRVS
jgi:hypothetical protein